MSELYIKQELIKSLSQTDTIILDIDGVVLDVSQSYRVAISETLQYYATQVMKLQDTGTLLPVQDIDLFKMAGGFNSDWDLTNAAAALILAKHAQTGATDTKSLVEAAPDWKSYTANIHKRGGGLPAAEGVILEFLTPTQRREFAHEWNQKLIVQLFQEIYGGDDACKSLYGFFPEHIHGEGLYKREKVLLDPALLPPKMKIAALTGRTRTEARLALRVAGLTERIPESHWVTEDDGVRKPDGRTLLLSQERVKFKQAIFIGDTMDDLQTVFNYRETKGAGRAKVYSCIALSGPSGESHRRTFLEAGTEIATPDANTILQYLNHIIK